MAEPPVLDGAFHRATALTVPPAAPELAAPIVGAPGTDIGVTVLDAAESGLRPTALAAMTRKEYAVPLTSPVITVDVAVPDRTTVRSTPPLRRTWTRYPVIGEPPSAPLVHETEAWALPRVAVTPVGAAGTVVTTGATGVTTFDEADRGPSPSTFSARTSKLYETPLSSPVTTKLVLDSEMPVIGPTLAGVVTIW
jgi:hypothetical protein